jgi:hypothetical protein
MKRLLLMAVMMGVVFAWTKSNNWYGYSYVVSGNTTITSPFINGGLKIQNQGVPTLNVTIGNLGTTTTLKVLSNSDIKDMYPLRFGSNYNPTVTLNATTSTNVSVIWYSEND